MKPVSFVNIKGVTAALETNPRVHASISALIKKHKYMKLKHERYLPREVQYYC